MSAVVSWAEDEKEKNMNKKLSTLLQRPKAAIQAGSLKKEAATSKIIYII